MYRFDPIVSSSPPTAKLSPSESTDALDENYITQPTQALAAPVPTQPTLMLTPRANRSQHVESSQLQVSRSSPIPAAAAGESPRAFPAAVSQSQSFNRSSNPMAPPGTSFFPPQAVRKPIHDLTSDDPPVESDPDEDESEFRSNIPLSKVELSSRASRVEETPQKRSWDLSAYSYDHCQSRKRASDDYGFNKPPKKLKQAFSQAAPSRAMPVDLTVNDKMTLDDVLDPGLKRKTERLQAIYTSRSVNQLHEALVKKKGHFDDACAFLAEQDSEDELMKSPKLVMARSSANGPDVKKTAQRTLDAPVKSLAAKYLRPSLASKPKGSTNANSSPIVIDDDHPKRKRRLIRGRRIPLPSSLPPSPCQSNQRRQLQVISSDEEHIDEGIVEIVNIDSDTEDTSSKYSVETANLVKFFNTCTMEEMTDLSGHKEEEVRELLDRRPFASLDAIRDIHIDLRQQKDGKKKSRKPRITFGARLVESAESMWRAYSTIDSVVRQCEEKGRPMLAGMARWGINTSGTSKEGGIDATTLDENSDSSSTRDSGYHTPRSNHGSDADEIGTQKTSNLRRFVTQPSIMNKDVELKDYQVLGLNWLNLLWQNKISGILADDMGLGKTCQVIAFLSHLKEQKVGSPALIIVPGSTLENWCREFQRFSKTISFAPYYGLQAERNELQDTILDDIGKEQCNVIITTYDLAFRPTDNKFLRRCRPQICIFDEGHVLKNANTLRYKSLMRIDGARCRILLTGTPLQNSLQELMSILGFLMPDVFYGTKEDDEEIQDMLQILFKHKARVTESESHSTLLSAQRVERARTMLTPFILRRKKAQVLKHLPAKTSRVEYCELTKTQRLLYDENLQRQRKILEDRAAGVVVKDHANIMMKLRQAAIHSLLFRHRYSDKKIQQISRACLKEARFAESDPDIIYEELQLYQDYQCHDLATKYPKALQKFQLQNKEWMDSGKVVKLLELLQKYKKNGDRALVFSQFTSVMDILSWVFEDHDINFMRMDGSTPIAERQSLMDIFYQDESIQLFMISTKSGGAGINLACANKVIIFDSSFNPQDDIQAENRAHRVGQTREVEVVRLVTRGTVEEQIYALGVSKLELDKMVQGEEAEDVDTGSSSKKKKADTGSMEKLSKAEEAGMEAVEQMLLTQFHSADTSKGDVKEQFLEGLKKAGLNVSAA